MCTAICQDGQVRMQNFIFGHKGRLVATRNGSVVADEQGGGDSTYVGQLRAFTAAISKDDPVPTSAANAVVTMRVIDDAYRAAGLLTRLIRCLPPRSLPEKGTPDRLGPRRFTHTGHWVTMRA
jgi:hypothetical protein